MATLVSQQVCAPDVVEIKYAELLFPIILEEQDFSKAYTICLEKVWDFLEACPNTSGTILTLSTQFSPDEGVNADKLQLHIRCRERLPFTVHQDVNPDAVLLENQGIAQYEQLRRHGDKLHCKAQCSS